MLFQEKVAFRIPESVKKKKNVITKLHNYVVILEAK